MSEDEIAELVEAITLQGEKIRDLKAAKASKDEITVEVGALLEMKNKLPTDHEMHPSNASSAPSKKEKEKVSGGADDRAAKKEARRMAREQAQKDAASNQVLENPSVAFQDMIKENISYGDVKLMASSVGDRQGREYVLLHEVAASSKKVWLRGYVHTTRAQSKITFVLLRQGSDTIQCVLDKNVAKWVNTYMTLESVVDLYGSIVAVPSPTKATISLLEMQVEKVFTITKATGQLPFQVIDACRTEKEIEELEKLQAERAEQNPDLEETKIVRVGLDTRMDNRVLDLRTPLSQAIAKITSTVLSSFRNFLVDNDFVEICTPKLLGGASEGGAEVFSTNYFGQNAFLAQSPQLHKQMSAACSGLGKVFEVGPVFRAENSNTNRHLCEFTGLDLEMSINEHYHEVLDTFADLFCYIFDQLNEKRKREIELIREYCPCDEFVYRIQNVPKEKIAGTVKGKGRVLRLEFKEAIAMLRASGVGSAEQGDYDDLSTPVEKKIGALVKAKYGVDFYFLDKFPMAPRPFYTMPCPVNDKLSNSYDFFMRGQEVLSGAQRVHDADLLTERIKLKGIAPETLRFYIDSFRYGALPHGGGGVGLERVVMLFLQLPNIRLVRLFPRDPNRLMP